MFTAIVFAIASHSPAVIVEKREGYEITTFDHQSYRFMVTNKDGGRTEEEVQNELEAQASTSSVAFVCNAGYFATDVDPITGIDLTFVNGEVAVPYRSDLSRPIIAFGEKSTKIFYDNENSSAYEQFEKFQKEGNCLYAVAGDSKPTKPSVKTARRIIGLSGEDVVFVLIYSANEAQCNAVIDEVGFDQYLYMDGGSSTNPNKKVTSHIVVLNKAMGW